MKYFHGLSASFTAHDTYIVVRGKKLKIVGNLTGSVSSQIKANAKELAALFKEEAGPEPGPCTCCGATDWECVYANAYPSWCCCVCACEHGKPSFRERLSNGDYDYLYKKERR